MGWQFADGILIPIELLDVAELAELPDAARTDLVKAAARLRDGGLSGALAVACAAADPVTAAVYATRGLGPRQQDSFQIRCTNALAAAAPFRPGRRAAWLGMGRGRRRQAGL